MRTTSFSRPVFARLPASFLFVQNRPSTPASPETRSNKSGRQKTASWALFSWTPRPFQGCLSRCEGRHRLARRNACRWQFFCLPTSGRRTALMAVDLEEGPSVHTQIRNLFGLGPQMFRLRAVSAFGLISFPGYLRAVRHCRNSQRVDPKTWVAFAEHLTSFTQRCWINQG